MRTNQVWSSSSFLASRCPFITYKISKKRRLEGGQEGGGEEGW